MTYQRNETPEPLASNADHPVPPRWVSDAILKYAESLYDSPTGKSTQSYVEMLLALGRWGYSLEQNVLQSLTK